MIFQHDKRGHRVLFLLEETVYFSAFPFSPGIPIFPSLLETAYRMAQCFV